MGISFSPKAIVDSITEVFKPIAGVIDGLHTSKEEKAAAVIQLRSIEASVTQKVMELEASLAAERAKIITAEAQSESALTRTWRPITMLVFVSIVPYSMLAATFGWESVGTLLADVPAKVWTMITVGIGGYIPMRSLDKWVKQSNGDGLTELFKKKGRRGKT